MALLGISKLGGSTSDYLSVLASKGLEPVMQAMVKDITNLIEVNTEALAIFQKQKFAWSGREVVVPLKVRLQGSFAGAGEGETLPSAGANVWQETKADEKFVYSQMAVSGPALASCTGKNSMINLLTDAKSSVTDVFRFHLQRMLWGDGSGLLCEVDSYNAGTKVVTIKTTGGTAFGGHYAPYNTSRLLEGAHIAWGTAAQLATVGDGYAKVVDILSDSTFEISTPTGNVPAAGDCFVMGDSASCSYNKELMGFSDMLSITATLQGLDPATYAYWKPLTLALNSGGAALPIEDAHFVRACALYGQRFPGAIPDVAFAHPSIEVELFNMMSGDRRFANVSKYEGGFSSLAVQYRGKQIPIVFDPMAPRNQIVFLEKKYWTYGWKREMGWVITEFNGGSMFRPDPSNTDQGIATYGAYGQFVTTNRRRALVMSDVDATVDFAG